MSTPKPVVNAVFPDVVKVGKYSVRPLSLANTLLLEKVDSPYLWSSEKRAEPGTREPDAFDAIRALYVLTRTTAQLRPLYEGFDREKFEDEVWAFSDTLPPEEAAGLVPALTAIFSGAASTMIGADSDAPEDEGADTDGEDAKKKKASPSKTSSAKAKAADLASR